MKFKKSSNNSHSTITSLQWGEIKRGAKMLFIIPIILLAACSNINPKSTNDFELKGKLSNANSQTLYLDFMGAEGIQPFDTTQIDDKGEFIFTSPIPEIGFYRLRLSDQNFATFILEEKQKVSVTGDANNLSDTYGVEGSPDSKLFIELNRKSADNFKKRDSIQKAFQSFANLNQGDTALVNKKGREMEVPFIQLFMDHQNYITDFVTKNSGSIASLAAIQQLKIEENTALFLSLDKSLSAKYPNSSYVQAFHNEVKSKTACAIGTPAPEINYNDVDGKPLALASLKGKVVLVDFWASWCRPCRVENPNLVRAYNKFKDKGFEIYSVSLDNNLEKWKYAIEKDGLVWKSHVSDFGGWKSSVVRDYNFNGIPYSVLIDKEGNVIAKNLRGAELDRVLSEVLK